MLQRRAALSGVPPDRFWDLSLGEILTLHEAQKEREQYLRVLAVDAAITVANVWISRGKKLKRSDFIPDEAEEDEVPTFLDRESFGRYMTERIARQRALEAPPGPRGGAGGGSRPR